MITSYCVDRVLRELARCLALMPNLQTIQIKDMLDRKTFKYTCRLPYGSEESLFKREFERYTFPSVRNVILPLRAHGLFICFPNAQSVILNQGLPQTWTRDYNYENFDTFVTEAAKYCHKVRNFRWFDEFFCGESYRERQ